MTAAILATLTSMCTHANIITEVGDWSNDKNAPTDLTATPLDENFNTFSGFLDVADGDEDFFTFRATRSIIGITIGMSLAEPPAVNRLWLELSRGRIAAGQPQWGDYDPTNQIFGDYYGNRNTGETVYSEPLPPGIYTFYLRETDSGINPFEVTVALTYIPPYIPPEVPEINAPSNVLLIALALLVGQLLKARASKI